MLMIELFNNLNQKEEAEQCIKKAKYFTNKYEPEMKTLNHFNFILTKQKTIKA